jgi:predicted amidophosphoribosyltransferase
MALKVVSFATYLTTSDSTWRDEDYCAWMFIKALKGKSFSGYGRVPVGRKLLRLDRTNADDAIGWFGEMAGVYLADKLSKGVVLVPIPNSNSTVAGDEIGRTVALAEAIASNLDGIEVLDCLRWKEEMTPSSQGGTRNPQELYDNLRVTKRVANSKIVLIDDVRTKGSHLIAAKARLRRKDARCLMAVCAGRTVLTPEVSAFSILEEELEDFVPS